MLEISTLGNLSIKDQGVVLTGFESRTVEALLVYLAYSQQPESREKLAEFFWSERSQAQSLTNLRVALFRLRQQLAPYLVITRKTIALDTKQHIWLDTTEFKEGLNRLSPRWANENGLSPIEAAQLEKTLALYQGNFLEDISLPDCAAFEEWKLIEREMLHSQVIEALHELVTFYLAAGVYNAGIVQATRLIELDPYRDESHQQLLLLLARTGQRSAALEHYENFRRLLLKDLAVSPSDNLAEIAVQIQLGKLIPDSLYLSLRNRTRLTDVEPSKILNPYKGLHAFQAEDTANFFGRERMIGELLIYLNQPHEVHFLAIVGPSGSGKSSLTKAGLLPAVQQEGLSGWKQAHTVTMSPGSQPFARLKKVLNPLLGKLSTESSAQVQNVDIDFSEVIGYLSLRSEGLILLIDQFEELFMLVDDEAVRSRFLERLIALITDPHSRVWVIITLRADFYDRPLFYPRFGELVGRSTWVVLPLKGSELEQAIVGPTMRTGLALQPGLLGQIIADVNEQPGALPLMQYALTELFDLREGYLLTTKAYHEIGGVSGATARRAQQLYHNLGPADREVVRQIFLRLITPAENSGYTRRRVPLQVLLSTGGAVVQTMLDNYGKYRLLTFDRDSATQIPTVEIAHEALVDAWSQLRAWLDEIRDDLRVYQRLTSAVKEWIESDYDPSFLATGVRLTQLEALGSASPIALSGEERAFIHTSKEQRDRLRREDTVRTRHEHAQRLAFEASNLLDRGMSGELPALLAIESLETEYSPPADASLLRALEFGFIQQQFVGGVLHVVATVFSPDDKSVLTGGRDKTVKLWSVETGRILQTFGLHDGEVSGIAFSPDGQFIVTSSYGDVARIWDNATGVCLRTLSGHQSSVVSVAWSPDSHYIVTGSVDQTARLWDANTGQILHILPVKQGAVLDVAFSPDSQIIMTCAGDAIYLWDLPTGELLRVLRGHFEAVRSGVFSPDGQYVLTGSDDKTAQIWDVTTGQKLITMTGHTDAVRRALFLPDGLHIITASFDKTVRLWDATTGTERHVLARHLDSVWSVAVSSDGSYFVTGSGGAGDQMAQVWGLRQESEPLIFRGHTGWVTGVAVSPNGLFAATTSEDGTARLWKIKDGEEIRRFTGHTGALMYVDFAPSGKYILTSSEDGTARLWDIQSGQEVHVFKGNGEQLTGVSFLPDQRHILTGSHDGTAQMWDVETANVVHHFIGHDDTVYMAKASKDGQLLLTTSADNTARLWDIHTAQSLLVFQGHTDIVIGAAFSPDGRFVATTSRDRTVRLWDIQDASELHSFIGHTGLVRCVEFSPNGQCIITSSEDKTARLWDVQTAQTLRVFSGHEAGIWRVAFTPDGESILTGAADNIARLWRTDYQSVIQFVRNQLPRDFTDYEKRLYDIKIDHIDFTSENRTIKPPR